MTAPITPMMRQYRKLKQEHPDCILLFRCGDFYEAYFDDAEEVGRILNIVVTRKTAGADGDVAMSGVPYHAIETHLARLIRSGRSVAIAEQTEDPKLAKGLVRREIVRVVTPGTALEPGMLEERANNYLVCVGWLPEGGEETGGFGGREASAGRAVDLFKGLADEIPEEPEAGQGDVPMGGLFGVAVVDLSTGTFAVTEIGGDRAQSEVFSELVRLEPAEVLLPEGMDSSILAPPGSDLQFRITRRPRDRFEASRARRMLLRQLGVQTLDGYGAEGLTVGLGAAGAVVDYLHETQKGTLPHINELRVYRTRDCMVLDATTQRSLELVRNLHSSSREGTLLSILDRTHTAMGGRLLRQWILQPLSNRKDIENRLDAIEEQVDSLALRSQITDALRGLPDLERVVSRVACQRAGPRDLVAVRSALERLPRLAQALAPAHSSILVSTRDSLDGLPDLCDVLRRSLVDEPPATTREGGMIRPGWNAKLDELKSVARDTKGWMAEFRAREARRLNLPNLKIGYNRVFGYYIEITKAQMRQVGSIPEDYQRRQTLANAERYITPDLKEKEEIILHAEERINGLEAELFEDLRAKVADRAGHILGQARLLARLDGLLSLAEAALAGGYARPRINDEGRLEIRDGRHAVLEAVQVDFPFVPNDTLLDREEHQIALITGPNMAGKSTYIRQVALIALLAHVGSFVPARDADVCLLDRIFTRVGAMDHLARGQSTFLVEMVETANILNNATDDSLVILDEIGRGTSTYDGMSIAWAVLEYLHNTVRRRPKTLFATHYHELTDLEGRLPRLRNYNVAVLEEKERIVFLYKIIRGPADRSYGIYAAKLAGVPMRAIKRAQQILHGLESGQALAVDAGAGEKADEEENSGARVRSRKKGRLSFLSEFEADRIPTSQLSLFDDKPNPVVEKLKTVRVETMTPIEALNLLHELKRMMEKE